ncbi:hypothetical protein RFI_19086 [Reticulomyxa filosa]|uniref:Uncharacterized protein n=1 Tax=Reticulomyxa filosa TaxID=46433 RepID=X6MX24_RETFI|nr:hypothetical protein RFI_19086 [Reticulomyxa filosa]|eukprot:ETO18191.1 hypothetical protein RFI_19086 [Reticulomyxa filosa]
MGGYLKAELSKTTSKRRIKILYKQKCDKRNDQIITLILVAHESCPIEFSIIANTFNNIKNRKQQTVNIDCTTFLILSLSNISKPYFSSLNTKKFFLRALDTELLKKVINAVCKKNCKGTMESILGKNDEIKRQKSVTNVCKNCVRLQLFSSLLPSVLFVEEETESPEKGIFIHCSSNDSRVKKEIGIFSIAIQRK